MTIEAFGHLIQIVLSTNGQPPDAPQGGQSTNSTTTWLKASYPELGIETAWFPLTYIDGIGSSQAITSALVESTDKEQFEGILLKVFQSADNQ